MSLIRWEPFSEMMPMKQVFDRLFEDPFFRSPVAMVAPEVPMVDLYETDDDLVMKATLPGVKPEDVEISVTGDTLTFKAEIKADEDVKKANYYRRERRLGSFSRTISLPLQVESDKAEAVYEHGILTLRLPKAEAIKPKSIKIRSNGK